jgi:hypothetical protein
MNISAVVLNGFSIFGQEKEYKDALEAFNEKSREKAQLITKLMEVTLILLV